MQFKYPHSDSRPYTQFLLIAADVSELKTRLTMGRVSGLVMMEKRFGWNGLGWVSYYVGLVGLGKEICPSLRSGHFAQYGRITGAILVKFRRKKWDWRSPGLSLLSIMPADARSIGEMDLE